MRWLWINRLDERPVAIVTPGQPILMLQFRVRLFRRLITLLHSHGNSADMGLQIGARLFIDAAARQLLAYGVETLCVLAPGGGCNIYSETPLGTFSVPPSRPLLRMVYGTRRFLRSPCSQTN